MSQFCASSVMPKSEKTRYGVHNLQLLNYCRVTCALAANLMRKYMYDVLFVL